MRYLIFGLCLAVLVVGCVSKKSVDVAADRQDILYSCNCGPDCKCNTLSTNDGNCSCGKPLKWGHVLKVEGSEAILCQCAEGCACVGLDEKDPIKCTCGTAVKRVDMSGTGIYYCNCGGSCYCNTVSDKPGACKCGMELKKS